MQLQADHVDILIVGGGIAGAATAFHLARDGAEVLVVERLDLGTQASGANAGSLHAQIPHVTFMEEGEGWARRFAPTIRLMHHSIELWRGLEAELGADLDVAVPGGLLVAATDAQMRDIARKAAIEREQGLEIELLTAEDVRRLAPYVAEGMAGGAFCPSEGKANPLKATFAYAAAAERHGARFLRQTEVTGVQPESGGFEVRTSGERLRCRRLVNCAGSAAGQVSAMLGFPLPIEAHPIQVSASEPVAPIVRHLLYYAGGMLTLKQGRNGSLLIGGGWPADLSTVTGLPVVNGDSLRKNLALAQAVVPAIGAARIVRSWAAFVNGTADWNPILGEVPGQPGFFVNFFPWMGFTAAPACARIMAGLVLGRAVEPDLKRHTIGGEAP